VTPRRHRLVVSVAALVAVSSGAAAGVVANRSAGSEPAAGATTAGVLSPRRAPALLRDFVAETRLASRVDAFMRSLPSTSCLVVRADRDTLASINADELLTPASAIKLTTAAAFLSEAGGRDRFTTRINGRRPDGNGVVNGALILEGGGDPLLATDGYVGTRRHPPKPATDFTRLVSELKRAGVRRVTGGIGVYDGLYDTERRVPSWSAGYTATGDVGPIGALAVDDGFSAYTPNLIAAPDPALAAGAMLRAAMVSAGIVVEGATFRARTAPTDDLVAVDSVPFAQVVEEMLRESDNNTAELLLKELARRVKGGPGTRANGVAARAEVLRGLGVDDKEIQAIDGSGLDRSDKATCDALVATLRVAKDGYAIAEMLPVAGQTGTLNDRFLTSPLAGKLRAKTGSLNGVTALVGIVNRRYPGLHFAFVANGSFSDAGGKALQDRLVAALATYPEAPEAVTLAP
jgi:serine-type D-Ala-D-Ala carboxypeptidase/endopeptidase (penicillin-binding protein 4)